MEKLVMVFFMLMLVSTGCNLQQPQRDKKVSDLVPANHVPSNSLDYLFQNWEVTDAEHPMVKDVFNNSDTGVYNFPGLIFLNDSFIVENPRGQIRFGKFSMLEKKIKATFTDGGTAVYVIKRIRPTEMQLVRNEKNSQTLLSLKADGKPFTPDKKNPYDPSLNQWRLKARKAETNEELKERLKQYVQFYANYFYDNLQRDAKEINFLGLPSCFKWYKGGIFIQNENKLDKKFIGCFYSKAQALAARQMLVDALEKKYTWAMGEPDWIKQTAPVLQQIHDSL
jgi:hypothetical protein